jgi:hypothetical protein
MLVSGGIDQKNYVAWKNWCEPKKSNLDEKKYYFKYF